MNEIEHIGSQIEDAVSRYDLKLFGELYIKLLHIIENRIILLNEEQRAEVNVVLSSLLTAYDNRDYLLISDVVNYELSAMLR